MRNLKRALSLALAAAMLIGMMVVGASAVSYNDFSDSEEIVNKDAVSMLTTLGVINGKEDGSYFDPTGNVTRAEMAKMISVMLSNNENCDDLYMTVNSGLTDIANSWARGYINYCYTLDIIAGRGNGTFDPTANVTGVEAAKMLLAALGYEAEIEGLVGTDWDLNTASLAHELGIFRNFTKDVNAPLNRDDAALLIYNTMDVEMIQQYQNGYALTYLDHRTILSSVFGVIRVEGVVVANEWAQLQETDSDAALREGRTTLDNVVWYDSTTSNTVVDEGVRETNPVTFNVSTPVEYMGQAVTMYVEKTTILSNSKVIGVATNDELNVIYASADGDDTVKDALDGTGITVDRNTDYYVNYGYCEDASDAEAIINNWDFNENGHNFNLNGVEVQVIDNDDDGIAEYVLYLQETLSEVVRYNDRDEVLTFHQPVLDQDRIIDVADPTRVSVDFDDVVFEDEIATDDLILYVEYGGRTYVKLADIVTDTLARVDRDKAGELYITLDNGDEYYESYIRDVASDVDVDVENFEIADARNNPGFDDLYDFILDSNGFVVAIRPAEEVVTNYALVLDSAWTQNALTRSGEVEILMADGTTGTYDIDWNESRKALSGIAMSNTLGTGDNANSELDGKLELYLASRDVHQDGNPDQVYRTGGATGSLITYSLDEDDVLTIEYIFQGNTFADNDSIEIANDVNETSTAGVGDNGEIVFIGRNADIDGNNDQKTNQYQSLNDAAVVYEHGSATLEVRGVNEELPERATATGYDEDGDPVAEVNRSGNGFHWTYAVDRNTVAFYFSDLDGDGVADKGEYGVAIGWDEMETLRKPENDNINLQVYPALEKTVDKTYEATNLAEVVLFDAVPETTSDDYMLVLDRNAYSKGDLLLSVVFEDGTVAEIEVDDIRAERPADVMDPDNDDVNEFDAVVDFDDDVDFMVAYPYVQNSDGTYDITGDGIYASYADRYREGTAAYVDVIGHEPADVDTRAASYITYSDSSNVWDVTGADSADDDVPETEFNYNITVFAVIVPDGNEIRTAWVWDIPETVTPDDDDNDFGWIERTWANNSRTSDSAPAYDTVRSALTNRVQIGMNDAQAEAADLEVQLDLNNRALGDCRYEIFGSTTGIEEEDLATNVAHGFATYNQDGSRMTVFNDVDLDDGDIVVIRMTIGGTDYYAAYEIVVD